jgi:hypothetical protein
MEKRDSPPGTNTVIEQRGVFIRAKLIAVDGD